jgi:hypothetical protein
VKIYPVALTWLALMTCLMPLADGSSYIYVKDITMRLENENATFELNYTLEAFTMLYVLVLGCRYIEPDLLSLLGKDAAATLVRVGPESAALEIAGAGEKKYGYNNSQYYVFKPRKMSTTAEYFKVIYPDGAFRSYDNLSETPAVFCNAEPIAYKNA